MVQTKFSKMLGLCSFIFLLPLASCKVQEKLPALGDQLAGSVDIATSPSGNYFYVLNSDYERRFNKGSIIIIDPAAAPGLEKMKALSTPRMGRSLHIAQNMMIATYADPEAKASGTVEIWDLTDETSPNLLSSQEIPCVPLNAILAPTTPYFTVSCIGGTIWMGKNPKNTAGDPTTMEQVRSYGYDRHALHFYEANGKVWLFGFPTDLNTQDFGDETFEDKQTYDATTDTMLDGANGTPDSLENTPAARRRWQSSTPYSMFIYPVTAEEAASKLPQAANVPAYTNFRYIEPGTFTKPSESNRELHYISYNLLEADGQASAIEQVVQANQHRYRTNFWDAKSGLENNASIFYLSQRGDYGSESNNVLRVIINDTALATADTSTFEQMFQVNRIYGFKIDRDNNGRFPGDFEFANLGGEPMLLLNSFRDLIYFANAPFYSITRKLLDNVEAQTEQPSSRDSTDFHTSFYQLAISKTGKVLTSSFYGNVLYLFDANPGISIKDQTPIEIQ